MVNNYKLLPNGAAINVFPISDPYVYNQHVDWKDLKAYYFTGLDFRMLICPFRFATDEPLLQRPGLYLKGNLPLGGVVYFPQLPKNYNENTFLDDIAWMVDSYLFRFNSSRVPFHNKQISRLYVDYASILSPGSNIVDGARIITTDAAKLAIDQLYQQYSAHLLDIVRAWPSQIQIANYAQTSLVEEVCTHEAFSAESGNYLRVIAEDNLGHLAGSRLTNGSEHIICTKKYNRTVLSFYVAAIRESFPNIPGAYIGKFKNFYNIIEYLMQKDGHQALQAVLDQRIGADRLRDIIATIKAHTSPQSHVMGCLTKGERLSNTLCLLPLSENDSDITTKIAKRLYTKRNAVFHSKKTSQYSISPGVDESSQLEADLAIIQPIAEIIVEELAPNE